MTKAKQDLETQLLGKPDGETYESLKRVSLQALEQADQMDAGEEGFLFFNEDGTMGRETRPSRTIEGTEAMEFIGLPPRPYSRLRKGDLSLIRWQFKDLFEKWEKAGIDANKRFWDNIRVRVVNKKNVGHLTRGCKAAGTEPAPYQGDILTGEAIKAFLPETKYSNAGDQYILQLLSIVVTEELENV